MRDQLQHTELVAELQTEFLAEDLKPPPESVHWSREKLADWFEAGGVEESDTPDQLVESSVQIPRSTGATPLNGLLLWPQGVKTCPFGLVWCSANPGTMFGSEHMQSAVPAALAAECTTRALHSGLCIPLLRFDYSGVRGSGGTVYDGSQPYHPTGSQEALDAFRFMQERGCAAVAIGGHSMGASMLHSVTSQAGLAAVVSCGTGPLVYRALPQELREQVRQDMLADMRRMPHGIPKLFIVGEKDRMSPRDAMLELLAAAPDPTLLHIVPAAGHNFELMAKPPVDQAKAAGREAEAAAFIVNWLIDTDIGATPTQTAAMSASD